MARAFAHRAARYVLPGTAAACFGFAGHAGWQLWRSRAEELEFQAFWDREAQELDESRVRWVQQLQQSFRPEQPKEQMQQLHKGLYAATVLHAVQNMDSLGPAGIRLKEGDTVRVLEEGTKMNLGFNIVQGSSGDIGIYPKAYLQGAPQASN